MGRFTKQKNFFLVIKAINQLSEKFSQIKLTIIGSGPKKDEFKKLRSKNIRILPWQSSLKKFLKSDLFILPSYYEGLPNVLIEAVNFGIPSISSDCSGAKDILLNGRGGFIFPNGNLEKLKKISFVISNYDYSIKNSCRKKIFSKIFCI